MNDPNPSTQKGMTYTGWRNLYDLSPIYEPTTPTETEDNPPPQRFQEIEASEQREVQRQLLRRIDTLETELERERLRLTACGVAAKADTPESAAKARDIHPDYRSASLDDVCEMVDRLMTARARLNEQESIASADAASSGKERLAQQVKRKMLENLDRSCDTTTAEIIQLVADWIAQALREEAGR